MFEYVFKGCCPLEGGSKQSGACQRPVEVTAASRRLTGIDLEDVGRSTAGERNLLVDAADRVDPRKEHTSEGCAYRAAGHWEAKRARERP